MYYTGGRGAAIGMAFEAHIDRENIMGASHFGGAKGSFIRNEKQPNTITKTRARRLTDKDRHWCM
jgi:hypothetical protein